MQLDELLVPRSNFNDVLDEYERKKLESVASDDVVMNALKKILLYTIYSAGSLHKGKKPYNPTENVLLSFGANMNLTHEEKGRIAESMVTGVTIVEQGFRALEMFKKLPDSPKQEANPQK